jgi:hypothetical protein
VAQLVAALRYKPESRVFDYQECHWDLLINIILCGLNVALGLTQPLTEIITRDIFLGGGGDGQSSGNQNSSGPVQGLL